LLTRSAGGGAFLPASPAYFSSNQYKSMLTEDFGRQARNNSLSHLAGQIISPRSLIAVQPLQSGIDFLPEEIQIYQ
jgi:hypothetical protein